MEVKGNYLSSMFTSILFPLLQHISPSLSPIRALERLGGGSWRATDDDPQFLVKSPLFSFLSGWIKVSVTIDSEAAAVPKLYIDFGEGYSEASVIYLRQFDEKHYRADIMLPQTPVNIRFDPVEEPTTFFVSHFQISVRSELLHTIRQFISIIRHDNALGRDKFRIFRKSYARYKKHGVSGMLERLEREYRKLRPYEMQSVSSEHIAYLDWIRENEKDSQDIFEKELFSHTPLISVVISTYNTPIVYLKKAIDSVIGQTYPNWELCIADDASKDKGVLDLLRKYEEKYDRIHLFLREHNGNISVSTNSALSLASGVYVAFMDHDDMLAPHALLEAVKVINANPNVKFIYSDEDKIDESDRRFNPHFKSDWNLDMFLSQNYISHLSIVKRNLLSKTGLFRVGYEGAQDFDLFLRIMDQLLPDEIIHIEKILYHWRAFEGSTALDPEAKSYTSKAGLAALKEYFSKKSKKVEVEMGMLPNTYKVIYPLDNKPLVSLIIPTRDGYDILSKCIESIVEKTIYSHYEIIIIDNQTTDIKTLEYFDDLIEKYQNIRIVEYDEVFNYAAINNFGVTHARGDLIGLINNDVEVISDHWMTEMVQHALREEVGAVGAKLYYDNDTIQHAGVILGIGGVAGHSHKYFHRSDHGYFSRLKIIQNLSAVTSACLILRKSIYKEAGGMNEDHLKVAFNDVDFCLKIHALGYRNLWTPYVELYHHESVSRGAEDDEIKRARFIREINYMQEKWGDELKQDPFYNSNLTLTHENFTIKKYTTTASGS